MVVTVINSDGSDIEMKVGDLEPGETGSGRSSGAADLAAGRTYPVEVTTDAPDRKGTTTLTPEVRVSS